MCSASLPTRGLERVGSNISEIESGEYRSGDAYCSDTGKVVLGGSLGRASGLVGTEAGTELQQTRPRNGPDGLGGWHVGSSNVSGETVNSLRLLVTCAEEAL